MYEVDLTRYEDILDRPSDLYDNIFYEWRGDPPRVEMTPELEMLADQAVELMVNEGFEQDEAHNRVALCIHAAATVSRGHTSQEGMEAVISDSVGRSRGTINPATAMTIAPYLPHVTSFEFDLGNWLTSAAATEADWEHTKPAMRWLELWRGAVSKQVEQSLIERIVKANGHNGSEELAHHVTKLAETFSDEPALLQQTLDLIPDSSRLPFFSYLGRSSEYVTALLETPLGEDILAIDGLARTVKHIDYFAADCPKMDYTHRESLEAEGEYSGLLTLIYKEDRLLGSIKMAGNASFLSHVTVEEDGVFPLVKGGVYVPTHELKNAAEQASDRQGKWARLAVDELVLRPIRFIDYDCLEGMGLQDLLRFLPNLKNLQVPPPEHAATS